MSDFKKFNLDKIKVGDSLLIVGKQLANKTGLIIELISRKFHYGITEGHVACKDPILMKKYQDELNKLKGDHKVNINRKINKTLLKSYLEEQKQSLKNKEVPVKKFIVVDGFVPLEKNIMILKELIKPEYNVMVVMSNDSIMNIPESIRQYFRWVALREYPEGRFSHVAHALKNTSKYMIELPLLLKEYHPVKKTLFIDNSNPDEELKGKLYFF